MKFSIWSLPVMFSRNTRDSNGISIAKLEKAKKVHYQKSQIMTYCVLQRAAQGEESKERENYHFSVD